MFVCGGWGVPRGLFSEVGQAGWDGRVQWYRLQLFKISLWVRRGHRAKPDDHIYMSETVTSGCWPVNVAKFFLSCRKTGSSQVLFVFFSDTEDSFKLAASSSTTVSKGV